MEVETTAPQPDNIPDRNPQDAQPHSATRGHRPTSRGWSAEYAESLLVTILLALFGTTFIVQAFKIPSQSMEPTLLVGDHLLVNKFIFEGRGAWYEKILPYRPSATATSSFSNFRLMTIRITSSARSACRATAFASSTSRFTSTDNGSTNLTLSTIPPTKIPSAIISLPPTDIFWKRVCAQNGLCRF